MSSNNLSQGHREQMKYDTARALKKRLGRIRDEYKKDWVDEDLLIRQRGVALFFIDELAFRAGYKKKKGATADKKEEGETADHEEEGVAADEEEEGEAVEEEEEEEEEGEDAEEEEEGEAADEEEEGENADEKEEGEDACAVGCCNLRVKHIELQTNYFVNFDFVGKNKIRYQKKVPVEQKVFENIQDFIDDKLETDELFDKLTPFKLNNYLKKWMPGLTIRVFRTCNASITLQNKLKEFTDEAEKTPEERLELKLQAHRQAVLAAAVLCNHQRAASKTFNKRLEKLQNKIKTLETGLKKAKEEFKSFRNEFKQSMSDIKKQSVEETEADITSLTDKLTNLNLNVFKDKEESMQINVATTINNYLDPRISVAWCKKWEVPVEKIYSPALMQKFKWAIDMAEDLLDYEF